MSQAPRDQPEHHLPAPWRWLGVTMAALSVLPMWHALAAVSRQDYVAGLLLAGLTWLLARTGVELVGPDQSGET
jgi:hypothetical protein